MKKNKGFFLVEIAIVILLLGIVISSVTSIAKTSIAITKYNNDKINRDIIVTAIASYFIKNKRLPKPSINMPGIETSNIDTSSKILIGKIPFKDLDILQNICKDFSQKDYIYIVINECTKTNKIFNNETTNILDNSDNSFEDTDCSYINISTNNFTTENICFVIIPEEVFKHKITQKGNKLFLISNNKNISALTKTMFINYYCKLQKQ